MKKNEFITNKVADDADSEHSEQTGTANLIDNDENNDEGASDILMSDINFGEAMSEKAPADDSEKEPEDFFFDLGTVTLLNNVTIYFPCYVEKHTVDDAIKLLKRVNQNIAAIELEYPEFKDKLMPKFVVNSGGGNVVQGLRLFDAIKNNPYPVQTIANGMAASMGIIILVAGKKVTSTAHSTLMIHQLSAGAQGKFFELKGHMKFWTQLQDKLASILVSNTKAKKEDIDEFMKGETYIMADEAIKIGLLDEIVEM